MFLGRAVIAQEFGDLAGGVGHIQAVQRRRQFLGAQRWILQGGQQLLHRPSDDIGGVVTQAAKPRVRVYRHHATPGHDWGRKVFEVEGQQFPSPAVKGRRQDVPVIWIGQGQGVDQGFKASDAGGGQGGLHLCPCAAQRRFIQAGLLHQITDPFLVNGVTLA